MRGEKFLSRTHTFVTFMIAYHYFLLFITMSTLTAQIIVIVLEKLILLCSVV
jgi:hypothetical protein